ncbi:MAG: DUF1343 domain-containing protein [Bacteroidota bacterium]
MLNKKLQILILFLSISIFTMAQYPICGAERTEKYFPTLEGKKIGIVANQTSLIKQVHLVDSLLNADFQICKVFAPEHGFRGNAEAGAHINNEFDAKTKLPIISLHGSSKKPEAKDLKGIDILVFDIQDVGLRFYTYVSTLAYVMEACAENNIPLLILDRPNPNAHYIDGPVLENEFKSFVGLLPIPVVYGMTLGEMALMINGEKWLNNGIRCDVNVIPVENYTHQTLVSLPIAPSPNLPNDNAIALYSSLCFFEGTNTSIGRGTDFPFEVIAYPDYPLKDFSFVPKQIPGKSETPPFKNQICYGVDLRNLYSAENRIYKIDLQYLIDFYKSYPDKSTFFIDYFNLLAGNNKLQAQIKAGLNESEIRESWKNDLAAFKLKRLNYLIYND